jgi:hypothetical protein
LKDFVGEVLDVKKGCAAIPGEELLKGLPTDYADDSGFRFNVPRNLRDHVEKLRQRAIDLARKHIIDDYIRNQHFTDDDEERIKGLLASNGAVWFRLNSRIKDCLEEVSLKGYRDRLAEQELATNYMEIADRSFAFPDPYESYYKDHEDPAERADTAKQSVVSRIFEKHEMMAVDALEESDFPEPKDLYLDETAALFKDRKKALTKRHGPLLTTSTRRSKI